MTSNIEANPAIVAFAAGLFDYAGLYPPAALPLDEAVARYLKHRASDHSWMLGPFVIHASRLDELHRVLAPDSRIDLSVLAGTGTPGLDWRNRFVADIQRITEYSTLRPPHGRLGRIASIETIQPSSEDELASVDAFVQFASNSLINYRILPQTVFVEVPLAQPPRMPDLDSQVRWAFKARCGGVEEVHVPSSAAIAAFVVAVAKSRTPFKATAGLHHPVRGQFFTHSIPMHGFLNVFGAAMIAFDQVVKQIPIDVSKIEQIVADEDQTSFALDDGGFQWRTMTVATDVVQRARREFALSIGSCSFSEPIHDLSSIGYI